MRIKQLTGLGFALLSMLPVQAQKESREAGANNLRYIDPKIGNVGQLLEPTRPTVQLPNQMIRMAPIRANYLDDQISSFPLTIVSHRLGEAFSIKPFTEQINAQSWEKKLAYDHDLETIRPWYYTTYFVDDEVTVSYVPGRKTGIFRFEFPADTEKSLLLGLYNGAGSWDFREGNVVVATEQYHGMKIHLYGKFSEAGTVVTGVNGQISTARKADGKDARAAITFSPKTRNVALKYAISFVSAEQAKKNFENELQSVDFETLKKQGEDAWEKVIGQINVQGGTEAQKRSFYTALYRTYERMVDISEDGQYYSGYDNKVHQASRTFYVDDWMWDTYLAQHPLRTILNPAQEEDMLQSFVDMYRQSGWIPTFPVLFGDNPCMNGFHSSIVLLDGYKKGLRNFDVEKAYEGMVKNANEATMLPWVNGPKCELDDFYLKNGYYPALAKGEKETVKLVTPFEKRQSVAVTLGGAYDDWAVGELAQALGKTQDYQVFSRRALNYKNLWNKEQMMFIPKDSKGNFLRIDPKFDGGMGGREYYDENNGYTYKWQVQHDIPGLIGLMGGKQRFEAELDQLFREGLGRSKYEFWAKFPDATGNVGQFSMGNEPSFHIPYLYNSTAPWKAQKQIRFLLDVWFKDNIFGIPGDEDGGGMTAFVVFSSMGFYPLTPGKPEYTIGSPLFEKTSIKLQNGKEFTVLANGASVVNKYIQSARFNGKALNKPSFTHTELMAGGTLELEMGPKPNKQWGLGE
ncbi:GH92 family glycosyl hydrolase [Dyadobacter sandarakinus]|uniref:Glycoside hydrolase family 92 protein n=1 Tax=Dyadobacter sandarakinus TaxID=2747268 RepID=A0ABX7I5D3_9BACT|nr:GH92 family glycosyl hydrolase [Dyadobacter sandarakinus]QRR01292.1 glycoside hydrolase family 92 protein [Dyadobacter sandarakinus]